MLPPVTGRVERTRVPEYRFYSLRNDKIAGPAATRVCDSDQDAIKEAKAQLDGLDIEIWGGTRVVARLPAVRPK